MEKKLKHLLFIIPIFLSFTLITNVKANSICSTSSDRQPTSRRVSITKTGITFSVPGIHDSANFYLFSLDGVPALCLDAGKPLRSVDFYLQSNSPINNIYIKKAYKYAKENSGDIGKRLVAQIVTWAARKNYTEFTLSVLQGFSNYARLYRGVSQSDALVYLNQLQNMNVDGLQLYIWEKPGSDMQNLVSEYGISNGDVPCSDTCRLEVVNEAPVCSGTTPSNYGTIYQQSVGNCLYTYDSSNSAKYNYYGERKTTFGTYCGMYCKESVVEQLPGNIAVAVNAGRYIVWPNNKEDNNSTKKLAHLTTYPLKLEFKKTCKILVDREQIKDDYFTFTFNDVDGTEHKNGSTISTIDKYKDEYHDEAINNGNNGCSNLNSEYLTCKSQPGEYKSHNIGYGTDSTCGGTASNPGVKCIYVGPNCSSEKDKLNACKAYQAAYKHANRVIDDFNTCISANTSNNYIDASINIKASYNDPEYGMDFKLVQSSESNSCENCTSSIATITTDPRYIKKSSFANLVTDRSNQIESRNIVASTTKTYDLDNGYYYYVNKDNNQSLHDKNGLANYGTIGFSNMPISYKSKAGKNYKLKLTFNVDGTLFANQINSQNYACHYKVTKTTKSCVCPEGTANEGDNLDCLIKEYNKNHTEKITCADGQVLYCDASITEQETKCDPITCPNDPSMDLTACINSGSSYDDCEALWCHGGPNNPNDPDNPDDSDNRKPVCPAGTNEGMDLTSCVMPMMNKGLSYEEALQYCVDVTCPIKGIKIIYRTISLTNPFPSYDSDSKITQNNLKVGMFNDTVKGRYPGSNWHSSKLVKTKILNNRGVDGDAVYNKTPLYTFVLNSDTIKTIRRYNNSVGDKYSDFKLNCVSGNSTGCVSNFVHNNSLSGLITNTNISTCGGTLTKDNFYTCDD